MDSTLAPLAGVDELADWIGEPIDASNADGKRAAMCLRLASALVRTESGRAWADNTGQLITPVPEAAIMVTLYCASRVYDNREAQTQGGLDDAQAGWKVDESGAYLTASEKRMLAPLRAAGRSRISTIETTRGAFVESGEGWVPTATPGVYFPW